MNKSGKNIFSLNTMTMSIEQWATYLRNGSVYQSTFVNFLFRRWLLLHFPFNVQIVPCKLHEYFPIARFATIFWVFPALLICLSSKWRYFCHCLNIYSYTHVHARTQHTYKVIKWPQARTHFQSSCLLINIRIVDWTVCK